MTNERPQTGEQQDRWLVNVANSGGWTVSLHTEEKYTEFVMYTRHEADELADYLNASLVPAAQEAGECWCHPMAGRGKPHHPLCPTHGRPDEGLIGHLNALTAENAALRKRLADALRTDSPETLGMDYRAALEDAIRENAVLRARAELADWLAEQYWVVKHKDSEEFNGDYSEIVTLPQYEDWEDVMYDWRARYDALKPASQERTSQPTGRRRQG